MTEENTDEAFLLDDFARNTAHNTPKGTPISIAPNVPYTDDNINGRIPYSGFLAVAAHVVPNRNSLIPISPMAGTPELTRNAVITITNMIERNPQTVNSHLITMTTILFFFMPLSHFFAGTAPALRI